MRGAGVHTGHMKPVEYFFFFLHDVAVSQQFAIKIINVE